ncbi:hypothetical protein DXG01_014735 [Tephrocybe rancida]|nr:hypothetical protein DXG01_014735 [Tephrocybe rancida]
MLSPEQSGKLLAAHAHFVNKQLAELNNLLRLVEGTITDVNSQEHKEWLAHMGRLCDVWERREAGDMTPWPDPPLTDEQIKATTPSAPSLNEKLSGYALREALRHQKRADLEDALNADSNSNSLETGNMKNLPKVHKSAPDIAAVGDGGANDIGKLFKGLLLTISGISNYFGKSNYGTYQLAAERAALGISEGMKSASETQFSTSYLQAKAILSCIPAIQVCVTKKTLLFNTKATRKLKQYLDPVDAAHYTFMSQLSSFVQVLAPRAKAIFDT